MIVTVTLLAVLAGCASGDEARRGGSGLESRTVATAPAEALEDRDGPGPPVTPSTSVPADSDPSALAVRIVQLYGQPKQAPAGWLASLSPHLTDRARTELATVDPTVIPALTVTGPARAVPGLPAELAKIDVPTTAGDILVVLVRTDHSTDWAVDRIVLPERVGD